MYGLTSHWHELVLYNSGHPCVLVRHLASGIFYALVNHVLNQSTVCKSNLRPARAELVMFPAAFSCLPLSQSVLIGLLCSPVCMSRVTDQAHYPPQSLTTSIVTEPLTPGQLKQRPWQPPSLYCCVIQISPHSTGAHKHSWNQTYTICKCNGQCYRLNFLFTGKETALLSLLCTINEH